MQTGPKAGRVKQFKLRELRTLPMYQPLPPGLPLNDKHYLHDPKAKTPTRHTTADEPAHTDSGVHGLTPQPPGMGARVARSEVSYGYGSEDEELLWCAPWGEGWMITRSDRVFSASINGDGTVLAVGGRDNLVAIYKLTWPKIPGMHHDEHGVLRANNSKSATQTQSVHGYGPASHSRQGALRNAGQRTHTLESNHESVNRHRTVRCS